VSGWDLEMRAITTQVLIPDKPAQHPDRASRMATDLGSALVSEGRRRSRPRRIAEGLPSRRINFVVDPARFAELHDRKNVGTEKNGLRSESVCCSFCPISAQDSEHRVWDPSPLSSAQD